MSKMKQGIQSIACIFNMKALTNNSNSSMKIPLKCSSTFLTTIIVHFLRSSVFLAAHILVYWTFPKSFPMTSGIQHFP